MEHIITESGTELILTEEEVEELLASVQKYTQRETKHFSSCMMWREEDTVVIVPIPESIEEDDSPCDLRLSKMEALRLAKCINSICLSTEFVFRVDDRASS